MTFSDKLTIIGIIIGTLLSIGIPLFIYLRNKFAVGAELTIELNNRLYSIPQGYSINNVAVDGVVDANNALRIFQLEYKIDIIIRNNSEHTAYYPKMYFKNNTPYIVKNTVLNEQEALASKNSKILKVEYIELEEAKGSQRTNGRNFPEQLKNLEILLEYKNPDKRTFYTLYNHTGQTNKFTRKRPKNFDVKF